MKMHYRMGRAFRLNLVDLTRLSPIANSPKLGTATVVLHATAAFYIAYAHTCTA